MKTFLEELAETLTAEWGTDLSALTVIFPNQRAGLFFKQTLAKQAQAAGRPLWGPRTLAFDAFLQQGAALQQPDMLTLQLKLWPLFHQLVPGEALETFIGWSDTLVSDFDQVDLYAADAKQLFTNLLELKEIEEAFPTSLEDMEAFLEFWKSFSAEPLGVQQQKFLRLWEILPTLYQQFRAVLEAEGLGYYGMICRKFAEDLRADRPVPLPEGPIVFAGFNALSATESSIVRLLEKKGRARFYVDADSYFVNKVEGHEAGRFMRRFLTPAERKALPNLLGKEPLHIRILGVPMQSTQAKTVGQLLTEQAAQQTPGTETAVVLGDEGLLFPVLYSLPESLPALNVTMGYPLRQSPVFSLMQSLIQLSQRARFDASGRVVAWYHKDLFQVLLHPFVQIAALSEVQALIQKARERGWVYIPAAATQELRGSAAADLLAILLRPMYRTSDALIVLREALLALRDHIRNTIAEARARQFPDADPEELQRQTPVMEEEILFHFYSQLTRISDALTQADPEAAQLPLATFWRILSQLLTSGRVPFSGEPLRGVQLMGLLETRCLNFDQLYVLSVNDGTLPAGRVPASLIPYNLRRAFGLPTLEDSDAVSAYNFYRLLPRARNVTLIYDTAASSRGMGGGERSRFILQLLYELAAHFPDTVTLEEQGLTLPIRNTQTPDITIEKTPEVMQKLHEYLKPNPEQEQEQEQRLIYPTDLGRYITCPLQFYFRSVVRLPEPEELVEELEAGAFGNVLHNTIEQLYKPYLHAILSPELIEQLKPQVQATLMEALEKELPESRHGIRGRNLLRVKVLERLVHLILDEDARKAPFQIVSLEEKLARTLTLHDGSELKLAGRADRIDLKDGVYQLIDYKTGKVEVKARYEDLAELFTSHKHKEAFQALYYAYLFDADNLKTQQRLGIQLYGMRDFVKKGPIDLSHLLEISHGWEDFERRLRELLAEILDPSLPFRQHRDEKVCGYCAYFNICYRS